MNRRWIAGLIGLSLAGCASPNPGTARREPPIGENSPFDGLANIHQTINNGVIPGVKPVQTAASPRDRPRADETAALPDQDPDAQRTSAVPPEPETKLLEIPGQYGRPAPRAGETQRAPRPQVAPDPRFVGRAAPFADKEPATPRPRLAPQAEAKPRPAVDEPPPALPPSTAEPAPKPAELPVVGDTPPPFEPPPPSAAPPPAPVRTSAAEPPSAPPPSDDGLLKTSGVPPMLARPKRSELDIIGRPAARVGDEIITVHQLRAAVKEKLDQIPPQERTMDIQKMVVDRVLENLVDRALILQAAKRQLKDPKHLQSFYDAIEKVWMEHEVPPMLKVHNAKNVYELKARLAEKGKSYDDLHEEFRRNTLAQEFLQLKIRDKLTVSLPEMLSYYDKHLKNYQRPPQISWREVVIDLSKYPTRADAKRKADAILARLRKGEDFEAIAKAESNGPNAAKGGLWETTPGSYGIESVNSVLDRIPVNQISPVIEAPAAFHIVRVEKRRPAGPARFDEVQDEVRQAVTDEKRKDVASKFITGLRESTIVRTMFDKPDSDPAAMKVGASAPAPPR